MDRINIIQQRLQDAFSPSHLEIIDDSERHKGHEGARGGAGHYTVIISAPCFDRLSKIDAHRKIYAALDDLIPDQIHALRIKIVAV